MRCAIYVRVSTDDQRDNGYSIDSQLRMIKEYCGKKSYNIVDVYNDAGHSGKDLMRPKMQRLLKDIKSHKIDKLIAIKVDRLTRNNYDGFWLLNYCEQHDVKIELILEPYDVSTANGEMIFGMNLVFGQRERKEIGARTKRAMEEMALEKVHPSKAPYGYTRNPLTGYLEIEPIEAQVVKEIFELCKQGKSTRGIAIIMRNNNAYLKTGKWTSDRVYKILTNSIYIGVKEIENLNKKKQQIDPYDELKDYTIELLKKLDCDIENGNIISNNKFAFSFVFNSLNRQAKKELIKKLIDKIEIKRIKNYDIEITNIKFTEEFISKSSKTYLKYLDEILQNNNIGFIYKEAIDIEELEKLQEDYFIFSSRKMENEEYSQADLEKYMALLEEHFYKDGVVTCPYIEDGNVTDHLTLISKI